jgi:methylated-DNA-[protein]-cysteine S-methyltransferase
MIAVEDTCIRFTRVGSRVGELVLVADVAKAAPHRLHALRGIYFADAPHAKNVPAEAEEDARPFRDVIAQLASYLDGARTAFDIALAPRGTSFQRDVWRALTTIPYGTTMTYAELARTIGRPRAIRAVGAANGKNPLSIVVPCHRVIGHDGTLTGYAGGMTNKRLLLDLEEATSTRTQAV